MAKYQIDGKDYLDLWKYCEDVGGKDKDRMVTISTWLLAFGVAIHAYIFTKGFQFEPFSIKECKGIQVILPALVGMVICVIAGYLICAYSAYANRYWYMAEWLEENKIDGLSEFHERNVFIDAIDKEANKDVKEDEKKTTMLKGNIEQRILKYLTKSTPATQGVIGVFKIMLRITYGLFLLFVTVFVLAIIYGK